MKYEVWDAVSYGEGESLAPFTKQFESDQLNSAVNFVDENEKKLGVLFVVDEATNILFDSRAKIYESPDGKLVFQRNQLSNKRVLLN